MNVRHCQNGSFVVGSTYRLSFVGPSIKKNHTSNMFISSQTTNAHTQHHIPILKKFVCTVHWYRFWWRKDHWMQYGYRMKYPRTGGLIFAMNIIYTILWIEDSVVVKICWCIITVYSYIGTTRNVVNVRQFEIIPDIWFIDCPFFRYLFYSRIKRKMSIQLPLLELPDFF